MEVEAEGGDGPGRPALASNKGCHFPGQFQYERFMSCLYQIIEKYPDVFFALGISPGKLGSHLARKGASSHACAGTMDSPPTVSMCLCAMWSRSHIKEKYLQYEKAGNQYVNNMLFAVPPPFFDFEQGNETANSIYSLMKEYMDHGDHVSASVHCIFYFCFA